MALWGKIPLGKIFLPYLACLHHPDPLFHKNSAQTGITMFITLFSIRRCSHSSCPAAPCTPNLGIKGCAPVKQSSYPAGVAGGQKSLEWRQQVLVASTQWTHWPQVGTLASGHPLPQVGTHPCKRWPLPGAGSGQPQFAF